MPSSTTSSNTLFFYGPTKFIKWEQIIMLAYVSNSNLTTLFFKIRNVVDYNTIVIDYTSLEQMH